MTIETPVQLQALEVFADLWCPFTHVGLRRIVAYRDQFGRDDIVIRVRAWPLELVNGAPLSPDLVAEEIEALRPSVASDLFAGFDCAHFPSTTLPALALVEAAYRRDDRTGEQVSLRLRTALFEEGRDISDPAQLAIIARAAGLESPAGAGAEQAVRDDWADGRRRGVIGSPHFFTDGGSFFCPSLAIERVGDHLQITTDPEGFSAFIAIVLAPTSRS